MRVELIMLLCVEKMLQDILIMRKPVFHIGKYIERMYLHQIYQEMSMEILLSKPMVMEK